MSCIRYLPAIRSSKHSLILGLEDKYGDLAPSVLDFPVYGNDLGLAYGSDISTRVQMVNNFAEYFLHNRIAQINMSTFLCTGNRPEWCDLLESSGYENTQDLVFSSGKCRSLSGYVLNDGLAYPFVGGISSWSMQASVGLPIQMAFAITALPQDRDVSDDYSKRVPELIFFKEVTFTIRVNDQEYLPVLTAFSMESGRSMIKRVEMHKRGAVSKVLPSNPIDSSWDCTIEIDRIVDYSKFKGEKIELEMNIGNKVKFSGTGKMKADPAFGSERGISTQALSFSLGKSLVVEVL